MNLFSNRELIIMASILGSILVLIIFISILEAIDNHKKKKEEINEEIEEESKKENNHKEEKIIVAEEPKKIVEEEIEVLDFDDEVIIQKEDLVKTISVEPKENIIEYKPEVQAKEELVKLEEELTDKQEFDYQDSISSYEEEQEKTAIISYDELVKLGDTLYTTNEVTQYDDGDEPITIDEVIKKFSSNDMVFENTANYKKFDKETESESKLIESYKNE